MLENLSYTVVGEAGDGVAVVDLARTLKPDLVIMDIKMPEQDGIAAALILSQERVSPVLLLTAYSDREFVDRAVDAGVMGYLVKPFLKLQAGHRRCARPLARNRQIEHDLAQPRNAGNAQLVERAKGVSRKQNRRKQAFRASSGSHELAQEHREVAERSCWP
jgi:response regulator NasT